MKRLDPRHVSSLIYEIGNSRLENTHVCICNGREGEVAEVPRASAHDVRVKVELFLVYPNSNAREDGFGLFPT